MRENKISIVVPLGKSIAGGASSSQVLTCLAWPRKPIIWDALHTHTQSRYPIISFVCLSYTKVEKRPLRCTAGANSISISQEKTFSVAWWIFNYTIHKRTTHKEWNSKTHVLYSISWRRVYNLAIQVYTKKWEMIWLETWVVDSERDLSLTVGIMRNGARRNARD